MSKITLKEFFEMSSAVIHCNTEEKANKLLKAFDKMGKKWGSGTSYLINNHWNYNKERTCYSNNGTYCDKEYYKEYRYTIFEFEDIIFKKEEEMVKQYKHDTQTLWQIIILDNKIPIRSVTLNEKKKITTVIFADGDKRMVKCGEHDTYSPEMGITYCIALKAMNMSKTQYKKMIDKLINKE